MLQQENLLPCKCITVYQDHHFLRPCLHGRGSICLSHYVLLLLSLSSQSGTRDVIKTNQGEAGHPAWLSRTNRRSERGSLDTE